MTAALFAPASAAQERFEPRFAEPSANVEFADTELSPLERRFVDTYPELRVAVQNADYPPYWRVGPDGEIGGYAIDLLQTIAAAAGFRLVPVVLETWPEVLEALETRRADVIPLVGHTPERAVYLDYTPGAFPDPMGLIGRAGDERFDGDETLDGVRVAVGRETTTSRQLEILYPEAIAVPIDSTAEGLDTLASGAADLALGSIVATSTAARERGALSLRVLRRVYGDAGWSYIGSRSDRPLLGQLLDRFVGVGRERVVEEVDDALGSILPESLAPLPLTAAEAARLGRRETLRLGVTEETPRLNGVSADGEHIGIASGFSAYVAYEFGLPTEIVRYRTLGDMKAAAEAGEIDLVPLTAVRPQGEGRFVTSTPYLESAWVLVGRAGTPQRPDLARFAGGRVGLRADHPLRPEIERAHPDVTLVEYGTLREMLRAVVRHEIDATVLSELVALPLIAQSFAGELQSLGALDAAPATFAFAAPPATADLIPLVDRALAQMDPLLAERLIHRWIAVDPAETEALRRRLAILVPIALGLGGLVLLVGGWNRRLAVESRRRHLAERRLIDMTEGLRTGVFQLRQRDGKLPRFVFSNSRAKRLARLTPDSDGFDSHERFMAHVHDEDRRRVGERMQTSLDTGEAFGETFRFAFPDGENGWVHAQATSSDEPDGARLWNGHLFDLTDERRLNERLASLLSTKEEFVAAAGHELRAPVQNLSLSLETLEASPLEPAQRERLGVAVRSVEDLRELVDDLLDIGQLDAHELSLRKVPVALHALFESTALALEGAVVRKGLTFECRVDPALPAHVRLDPVRTRQILHNLVGNATKYTDAGGIALAVTAGDRDVPDGRAPDARLAPDLLLEVHDTGTGIPASRLAAIFEPFSTVGPMKRRGSGLGLAICRRLVALMDGVIRVESEVGRGSTFRVCLPLEPCDAPTAAPDDEPSSPAPARAAEPDDVGVLVPSRALVGSAGDGERVLLVDDDPLVRETLAALLRRHGLTLDEAGDATEALGRLDEHVYTAVVTDQRMPGMSGIELARIVRRRGAGQTLVLMTGGLAATDDERAADVFDEVLIKPVTARQVALALEGLGPGAQRRSTSLENT